MFFFHQVLQESIQLPGTGVNLVYHSSETPGYSSVILIQMTPKDMPPALAVVHLRVSVEGIQFEKKFEADPQLKYTYAWDRRNAYRQKVYGIVPVRGQLQNIACINYSSLLLEHTLKLL